MGLMAQESYSDEDLEVSEIVCQCGANIVFHGIPMKPLSLYLENYDEMIQDMNKQLDYFYCSICCCKICTTSKVIKIFTMRKS